MRRSCLECYQGQCLSEAQVVDLIKDFLEIIVFVHSNHVIHRDVKPSNLITGIPTKFRATIRYSDKDTNLALLT